LQRGKIKGALKTEKGCGGEAKKRGQTASPRPPMRVHFHAGVKGKKG